MSKADYVNHYNNHYAREGKNGSGQLQWRPQFELWKQLGYKQGMEILDYGCGIGIMLEGIKDHSKYLGVDISPNAIRLAEETYPDAHFEVSDMGELSCEPKDWVVAQSVFTHVPKIFVDMCLKDLKQAMKPNAICLIDIIRGEDDPADYHVRRFKEDEWQDYLWKAGLDGNYVTEIDWVGYIHSYYEVFHDR